MKATIFACAAALGLIACAPPNVLVTSMFLKGNKISKSFVTKRGDDERLFNYSVRVCDVRQGLALANCQDTLVVERVVR